ncbi:hypothetical protein ACFWPU_00940 [Streptomyces sp. NPDC058471]|uniref:hypothetical protein n=1 Tax=Streptomyces sp. NPDC058471 TaxID=3346516 RepID=UPI00365BEDCA
MERRPVPEPFPHVTQIGELGVTGRLDKAPARLDSKDFVVGYGLTPFVQVVCESDLDPAAESEVVDDLTLVRPRVCGGARGESHHFVKPLLLTFVLGLLLAGLPTCLANKFVSVAPAVGVPSILDDAN